MENKIYGYVRVSSTDQNEDRQMMALNKVNVPEKNIYICRLGAAVLRGNRSAEHERGSILAQHTEKAACCFPLSL